VFPRNGLFLRGVSEMDTFFYTNIESVQYPYSSFEANT